VIYIDAGEVRLQAQPAEPREKPLRGAAVLCHPHPSYGGTMHNRVVYRAGKAAMQAGLATLRFNFRGVEGSSGEYDRGIGEKLDVRAAVDWLERTYPRLPLGLIGFSFGSWVGLQVGLADPRIRFLIGLGLPVSAYDFRFLTGNPKQSLFVCGTNDEFCPGPLMNELIGALPSSSVFSWIEGADHFFSAHIEVLQQRITTFLRDLDLTGGRE
jgi:uncharacterized protein